MSLRTNKLHASAAVVIIPTFVFFVLLQFLLPPHLTSFFLAYSPLLLFSALLLLLSAYFTPPAIRPAAVFGAIAILFALTLSYKWTSGHSDAISFGGTIPYKDAFNYYNGSRFILKGDRIPGSRWQAAWRPLFPGFFSALLLFMRQNLKWSLALLTWLTAWSTFLAAEQIYRSMGRMAASAFAVLTYLFLQPMIGVPLTEPHGLLLGTLGFLLIWYAARHINFLAFLAGILVLMTGVSSRAGAFFIFPMLILWSGFAFRKDRRFNLPVAAAALAVTVGSYLLVNNVFPWIIVGEGPGKETFGNFAYTLYGQVMGGTGWGSTHDLGLQDSGDIYRVIIREFLDNPSGLMIGMAHSYADFFLPGARGIFSFSPPAGPGLVDMVIWYAALMLLGYSTVRLYRSRKNAVCSLLLLALAGILLSVPFLPPRDGGNRFYASTMPFFFAALTAGLTLKSGSEKKSEPPLLGLASLLTQSGILLLLTMAAPLAIILAKNGKELKPKAPSCPQGQVPFSFQLYKGSYIDINPDNADCGIVPDLCLQEFTAYGTEADIDPFYDELAATASEWPDAFRIAPANDLVNGGIHFFAGSSSMMPTTNPDNLVQGCAETTMIKSRSLYIIRSTNP